MTRIKRNTKDQPAHSPLPSLNGLRAFDAVARLGSFSKAAAELNVTHGAVSRHVKALEDFLELKLLDRSRQPIGLTPKGRILSLSTQRAFGQLQDVVDQLTRRRQHKRLTLSTVPSFAGRWLVPRLTEFYRHCPEIDLRIEVSAELNDLARDGIDVAVRYGRGNWPGVSSEFLFRPRYIPVCSPELAQHVSNAEDLLQLRLLHHDSTEQWRNWFKGAGVSEIPEWPEGVRVSEFNVLLQAALEGCGVCLAPELIVADDLRAKRLVIPVDHALEATEAYYVVFPSGQQQSRYLQKVTEWLKAELAASAP